VKLLFDQNVSYRIVRKLDALFPKSEQVKRLGYDNKSDRFLWEFAKRFGFTIVTYDSDFHNLSQQFGHPPKLIWVKSKNQTTDNLERLFLNHFQSISDFENDNIACLKVVDPQ
jgi:predicted nuclease of predicted toxin-antitoxin system